MDAIVFDWDGTLVDSLAPLYRANIAVLGSFGISVDAATYRQVYSPDWRRMYRELGVPADSVDEAGRRWSEVYGSGGEATAFPGVAAALERLASAGFRMGIVTASTRAVVTEQARRFGLDSLLPVRVHADDLEFAKPHPAPLARALAELGVRDPARAAYVGDVPDDMRMARAVGACGVGILGPMGTPSELAEAGATVVAPSVVAWVDELLAVRA